MHIEAIRGEHEHNQNRRAYFAIYSMKTHSSFLSRIGLSLRRFILAPALFVARADAVHFLLARETSARRRWMSLSARHVIYRYKRVHFSRSIFRRMSEQPRMRAFSPPVSRRDRRLRTSNDRLWIGSHVQPTRCFCSPSKLGGSRRLAVHSFNYEKVILQQKSGSQTEHKAKTPFPLGRRNNLYRPKRFSGQK